MMRRGAVVLQVLAAAGVALMLTPAAAGAQTNGLAGVVRDTTGAVLPGVTIEASSPALIEKIRTAVTDEGGLYRIVDLRPGVYRVTFSLTGFSPVSVTDVSVTGSSTTNVNAELRV